MININNIETKSINLSDINSAHKREVPPLRLNDLCTDNLTPAKNLRSDTVLHNHNTSHSQSGVSISQEQLLQIQASPAAHTSIDIPISNAISNSPLQPAEKLLKKGEKYSITGNHPSTVSVCAGFGWDFSESVNYDIDIEAFMLDETEKVPDDSWIVFYGQLSSPDSSVVHKGACSVTDREQINITLSTIDKRITKIVFVMTINEAKLHGYNFSKIKDAYIRLTDSSTEKELFRYELTDYYPEVVSMVVGELYLRNNEWRFNSVGMGTGEDLEGMCNRYGIEVKQS